MHTEPDIHDRLKTCDCLNDVIFVILSELCVILLRQHETLWIFKSFIVKQQHQYLTTITKACTSTSFKAVSLLSKETISCIVIPLLLSAQK